MKPGRGDFSPRVARSRYIAPESATLIKSQSPKYWTIFNKLLVGFGREKSSGMNAQGGELGRYMALFRRRVHTLSAVREMPLSLVDSS